jgi:hypothetical protein
LLTGAEGNMCDAVMRGVDALPWSKTSSRTKGSWRNLGGLAWPAVAQAIPGRDGKSEWTTPSRNQRGVGRGSWYRCSARTIPRGAEAESVEGSNLGQKQDRRSVTRRTPSRQTRVTAIVCPRTGTGMGIKRPERQSRSTFGRSPVRESRTPGSVRGAVSNHRPYRDP